MSQSAQLSRQWKIITLLDASRTGLTVEQLVDQTQVSDKTIRRDLKVLGDYFQITEVVGQGGLKRWNMDPLSTQLDFTLIDLISIVMSRRFLEPLAGTPFWEGHQKVLTKVQGILGQRGLAYCQMMQRFLHSSEFGHSDYSKRGEIIDRLIEAMEDSRSVLVVYQSIRATEPVEQELGPLGLIWHTNGSLYLVAWSARREEIRNYKVDRIEEVSLGLDLPFQVPDDFDMEDWKRQSFGGFRGEAGEAKRVSIFFPKTTARYVQESKWHPSQQLQPHPDGSVTLSVEVTDFRRVTTWLLSFGSQAKALSPPEFVEAVEKEINAMHAAYNTERNRSVQHQ